MEIFAWVLLWLFQFVLSPINLPVDKNVSNSDYYGKYFHVIYYCQDGNWFELGCEWIPSATFFGLKPLGQTFAKNDRDIYFKHHRVTEWVDHSSFAINRNLPMDKNHVYEMSDSDGHLHVSKIAGADPQSFEEVSDWNSGAKWHRDNRHYFLNGKKTDVDRGSFTQVCAYLYKDKSAVFSVEDNALKKLSFEAARFRRLTRDSCTDDFSVIRYDRRSNKIESYRINRGSNSILAADESYLIYTNRVIYHGVPITMADAGSFTILTEFYAKDKFRVYFSGKPLKGADPTTFVAQSLYSGKDKNFWYCRENQVQENYVCK